jgi:hypothetical protein
MAPEKLLASKHEMALQYAKERHWAVLPLWWITRDGCCACGKPAGGRHKPGKHPIGKLVPNGYKNATRDLEQIRDWWRRYPEANVGVVMGDNSNAFTIDLDGARAHELLDDVRKANNAPLIKTLISQSGRGPDGHHVVFNMPPGLDIGRVTRKDIGVDIIGNGGYIVAPPSNHISGGVYKWISDHPVADPDPWLVDWVLGLFDGPPKRQIQERSAMNLPGVPPAHEQSMRLADRALAPGPAPLWSEFEDARLRSALNFVDAKGRRVWDPNDPSYETWGRRVAPAIASLGWESKGEDIFVDWSAQTTVEGLFPGEEACREQVRFYKRGRVTGCITEATIFARASKAGWDGFVPRLGSGSAPLGSLNGRHVLASAAPHAGTPAANFNSETAVALPHWPDTGKGGRPRNTYRNARAAIMALGVTCRYDSFHDRKLIGGHAVGIWAGQLSDAACYALRQAIIDNYNFDPGKDNVNDAAVELCIENRFDPVSDYLDSLKWDGVPRLDSCLTKYLGADDTRLNSAIGRLTLVAAVRRVRQPGCKFDHMPVFEGPEARMKSTAVAVLAGAENFSDQTILTASDREQQELVAGVWFYEIPELAGMRKAEIEKVKAFITRTHDRARGAYKRNREDAPRRCVFIGTTNESDYLKSQTGNRRFWPVQIGIITIDALRHDRDQLFAEAAAIEATGAALMLPEELWGDANIEQEKRLEPDPWDDVLASTTGTIYPDDDGTRKEWIKVRGLLVNLDIARKEATTYTYKRLKSVMRRLGWSDGRHYFGGQHQERGYWRRPMAIS